MTGPTDAGQLLALAAEELHQLSQHHRKQVPAQLAAAWPAFLRNGEHLVSALNPQSRPATSLWPERQPGRPAPPLLPAEPDEHLQRAADLLGAAADLIGTRVKRGVVLMRLESSAPRPGVTPAGHRSPRLARRSQPESARRLRSHRGSQHSSPSGQAFIRAR